MDILIDADIMCYQIACVNDTEFDWGSGVTSRVTNLGKAKEAIDSFVDRLLNDTETEEPVCCFTKGSFRYDIFPEYKANRKDVEKPILLDPLKDYVRENYKTKELQGLEADDVLGIFATYTEDRYVIASIDKDLLQIPGYHYDWKYPEAGVFYVDEDEADYQFMFQVLTGDSVDNFKGCPSIGKKRAERILEQAESQDLKGYWQVVKETYELKEQTYDYLLQQARVARILRKEDWDYENERPILWVPSEC